LNKSKAQNAGWIVITWRGSCRLHGRADQPPPRDTWQGAHLNPAVTIGLASISPEGWGWGDVRR